MFISFGLNESYKEIHQLKRDIGNWGEKGRKDEEKKKKLILEIVLNDFALTVFPAFLLLLFYPAEKQIEYKSRICQIHSGHIDTHYGIGMWWFWL